ncbi:MAG: uracil-DNA glycosylase [Faecalibacterium sp.]
MTQFQNSWDDILKGEFEQPYYQALHDFLQQEYTSQTIHPDRDDIFNTLKETPYEAVKVVILGQDPYHGEGQGHGFAFSVRPGIKTPPSLKNMYKELAADVGTFLPNNGYLLPWAKQGVLMLNAVLTVRDGQANSHKGKGWETFTDHVIAALNRREAPVIFLLWGRYAQNKGALVTNPQHLILNAAHPSPLSAHNGFFGCKHFSQVNAHLIAQGQAPIDWQIENI